MNDSLCASLEMMVCDFSIWFFVCLFWSGEEATPGSSVKGLLLLLYSEIASGRA